MKRINDKFAIATAREIIKFYIEAVKELIIDIHNTIIGE